MLRPSDRAPGLMLGEHVALPDGAEVGANVVIHEGTAIGVHAARALGADRRGQAGDRVEEVVVRGVRGASDGALEVRWGIGYHFVEDVYVGG